MNLSRAEHKSLALHRSLAAKLQAEPQSIATARRRLNWLRMKNPAAARYYDEWDALLDGDIERLIAVMTDASSHACALRQENPFVDLVDQRERARIYREVANKLDGVDASRGA
jgi:hypothetical protein